VFIGGKGICDLLHEVLQLLPEESLAARGFGGWMGNYASYVGLSSQAGCEWMGEARTREPKEADDLL
jgi:hypothetical protein